MIISPPKGPTEKLFSEESRENRILKVNGTVYKYPLQISYLLFRNVSRRTGKVRLGNLQINTFVGGRNSAVRQPLVRTDPTIQSRSDE